MKKHLLLLFSLALISGIQGQIVFQEGPTMKKKMGYTPVGFIFADSTKILSIDNSNQGKPLLKIHVQDSFVLKKEIKLIPDGEFSNSTRVTYLFSLQNHPLAVYERKLASKDIEIYACKIESNGQLSPKMILDTLKKSETNEEYTILVNENETSFLYLTEKQLAKNKQQEIQLKTYTSDLTRTTSDAFVLPDTKKQYIFSNWRYSSDNNLTFLARHILDLYKPGLEFAEAEENSYVLFNIDLKTKKTTEIEIRLHHRFIDKIDFVRQKERTVVSGIYANDKNFFPDGIFTLQFDSNLKKTNHLLHDFTKAELKMFHGKQRATRGKKLADPFRKEFVADFLIQKIVLLENGDFVVATEEYRKEWEDEIVSMSRDRSSSQTCLFYHQNILLFWFSEAGNLKNSMVVEKNQVSQLENDPKNSFYLAKNKNSLFLFFNENTKNLGASPLRQKITYTNKKKYLKYMQINSSGIQRTGAISSSPRKTGVFTQYGEQLQDQAVYFVRTKSAFKTSILKFTFPR